jgi:serine protease Do
MKRWLLFACLMALLPSAQAAPPGTETTRPTFAPLVTREEGIVVSVRALGVPAEYRSLEDEGWKDAPPPDPFSGRAGTESVAAPLEQALGSGFVIGADGWVLTNAHVVAGATRLRVRVADGRDLRARIAGLDARTDIALLQVDGTGLPVARIGDSSRVAVGDWVLAIGAPFGLDASVTAGIVSAYPRYLPGGGGVPMIQTDVAINPGSSGSPLFNLAGEVVGINSMMMSASGGYEGVSLAVPIHLAMRIAADLREHGGVRRSHLGAQVQEVTADLARSFGLAKPVGALVLSVARDGPADRAGLRTGDIVLGIEGATDRRYAVLQQAVADAPPEVPMRLEVWRRGAVRVVNVSPAAMAPDMPGSTGAAPRSSTRDPRLGLVIEELTPARREALRLPTGGVQVRIATGASRDAGVRNGDLVLAVDDVTIADAAAFDAALAAALAGGRPAALLIERGGALGYIAVERDDEP